MNVEPTLTQGIIFSDLVIKEQGTGKSTIVGSFGAYNLPQVPMQVPPFFTTVFVTNITPRRRGLLANRSACLRQARAQTHARIGTVGTLSLRHKILPQPGASLTGQAESMPPRAGLLVPLVAG